MSENNDITVYDRSNDADEFSGSASIGYGDGNIKSIKISGPLAFIAGIPLFIIFFVLIMFVAMAAGVIWMVGGKRIARALLTKAMKSRNYVRSPYFDNDVIDIEGDVIDIEADD